MTVCGNRCLGSGFRTLLTMTIIRAGPADRAGRTGPSTALAPRTRPGQWALGAS
jgi:hypothetical protein